MSLNNKYKDSMDKIIVDEEMKKRILTNLSDLDKIKELESPKRSLRFIRTAGMYAACFAVALSGMAIKPFLSQPDLNKDKSFVVENDNIGIQNENHGNNSYVNEIPDEMNIRENCENDNISSEADTYNQYSVQKENPEKENNSITHNSVGDYRQNSQTVNDNIINTEQEKETVYEEGNYSAEENVSNDSSTENLIINEESQEDASNISIENMYGERSITAEFNDLNALKEEIDFQFKISQVLEANYEKNINLIGDDIIDIAYTKDNNIIEYKVYKGEQNLDSIDDYKEIEINNKDFKFNMNEDDTVKSVIWQDDNIYYSIEAYENISQQEAVKIVESLNTFN